ncbi:uncharacterized protein LOC106074571 isoform X1 [Biomphalaria glabrata]|uniref:Uncharacterized protein LOC106074571 isoform X1 n=3 Tax=Biomphalaria glabrata TaxID=6526 RepID=A0A9U8EKB5_BIOGL|nr:uncharacterized protein LOC106074571 isoform X1 [Biomphalaria glabrata]
MSNLSCLYLLLVTRVHVCLCVCVVRYLPGYLLGCHRSWIHEQSFTFYRIDRMCSVSPWSMTDSINLRTPTMQSTCVHLVPNTLALRPTQWTSQDVKAWLRFCVEEFSLSPNCVDKFDMNGKALCLLERKDFMERSPACGDVLYNAFKKHQHQWSRQIPTDCYVGLQLVTVPPNQQNDVISSPPTQGSKSPYISILPRNKDGIVSKMSCSESMDSSSSQPMDSKESNISLSQGVPTSMLSPAPSERCTSDSENGSPQHNSDPEMEAEFDPEHPTDDGVCRLLWEFIYQLLLDGEKYSKFVLWESEKDLTFRINNPNELAEFWGKQKNRTNMTYEKLSRALRYYYKMDIIKKVPGKRLTYQFLQHPKKIRKGQRGARPHCNRIPVNGEIQSSEPIPIALRPSSALSGTKSPPISSGVNADNCSQRSFQISSEYKTSESPSNINCILPPVNVHESTDYENLENKMAARQEVENYPQNSLLVVQKISEEIECDNAGEKNLNKYNRSDVSTPPYGTDINLQANGIILSQSLSYASSFSCVSRPSQTLTNMDEPSVLYDRLPLPQHTIVQRSTSLSPKRLSPEAASHFCTSLHGPKEAHYRQQTAYPYVQLHLPQHQYGSSHSHHYYPFQDSHSHSYQPISNMYQPEFPREVATPQEAHLSVKYETCDEQPEDLSIKPIARKMLQQKTCG